MCDKFAVLDVSDGNLIIAAAEPAVTVIVSTAVAEVSVTPVTTDCDDVVIDLTISVGVTALTALNVTSVAVTDLTALAVVTLTLLALTSVTDDTPVTVPVCGVTVVSTFAVDCETCFTNVAVAEADTDLSADPVCVLTSVNALAVVDATDCRVFGVHDNVKQPLEHEADREATDPPVALTVFIKLPVVSVTPVNTVASVDVND